MSVYPDIDPHIHIEPCPWCGMTEHLVEHKADYDEQAYDVQCEKCQCSGPYRTKHETAIELWNKRGKK